MRVPSGSVQTPLRRVFSSEMKCLAELEEEGINDILDRLKDTFHVVLITRPMLFLSPQLCVYLIMISALLTSLLRACLKSFFTPLYLWINLLTPLYSRVSRRRHVLNLKRKFLMCAHPCHVRHQNQEQSNMLT